MALVRLLNFSHFNLLTAFRASLQGLKDVFCHMVVVTGLIVKFSVAILAVYYGKEMTWFITTFDLLTCVIPLTLTGVLTELIGVKPLVTRITKIESMIRFAAMVVLTLLEESDNIGGLLVLQM